MFEDQKYTVLFFICMFIIHVADILLLQDGFEYLAAPIISLTVSLLAEIYFFLYILTCFCIQSEIRNRWEFFRICDSETIKFLSNIVLIMVNYIIGMVMYGDFRDIKIPIFCKVTYYTYTGICLLFVITGILFFI